MIYIYTINDIDKDWFLHDLAKYNKSYAALTNEPHKTVVGIFLKRRMIYKTVTKSR